jgi:hypothetical protein
MFNYKLQVENYQICCSVFRLPPYGGGRGERLLLIFNRPWVGTHNEDVLVRTLHKVSLTSYALCTFGIIHQNMKTYGVIIKLLLVVVYLCLKFLYSDLINSKATETILVNYADEENSHYHSDKVLVATHISPD